MKRFLFFAIPLSLLLLTAVTTEQTSVAFYPGTFAQLQYKAKTANKPFILDFYTVWCGPCKNMEKYTFTNPELAKYIKENYLAFKVDGESIMGDGIEVAQKYDVRFYPTLIIFSPEGAVLKRLNGFQSAEVLLQELKKYENVQAKPENKPADPVVTGPAPTPMPPATPGEGLFKMSVSRQEKAGFGVQIASYGDYANVLKETEKLEQAFHRNVLVNISKSADKTIFKLILGPFDTKVQAETYLKEIKEKEGRSGLVVDLGKTASAPSAPSAPGVAATAERGVNPTKRITK